MGGRVKPIGRVFGLRAASERDWLFLIVDRYHDKNNDCAAEISSVDWPHKPVEDMGR